MHEIQRTGIDEDWAHSAVVVAGDNAFVSYCMKYEGDPITRQMQGAFDVLEERLSSIGLSLKSVVKIDCLFRDIMDIHYLGDVIKERFDGDYPARKAYETRFLREGILFQVDAIAYVHDHVQGCAASNPSAD